MKNILTKTENQVLSAVNYISKHRVVITIFVVCSAVLIAVIQTQSYLNPERNEEKYLEVKSSISTKEIDKEIINKLRNTQFDRQESAESIFVDDRTNPFAE